MMFGRRGKALEDEVAALRELVGSLSRRLDVEAERAEEATLRAGELADRIKSLEARPVADRLDGKLSKLDDRLGHADDRAKRAERDLGTLAGRLQRLEHQAAIDAETGRRALVALLERIETKAAVRADDD